MNLPCDKIKVLHVITRLDKGGSAENTFLTVRDLDKTRYDLLLVTGFGPPEKAADPEVRAAEANLAAARERCVRIVPVPHLVRDLRPLADLTAFFSLLRIIRREGPHIVHTHTSKAGILGRWAAFFCRTPIICHTPHGHVFWGYFGPLWTRLFILLERWTARITDAIVVLTPQEREDHLRFHIAPEEKFTVIHSGVDLDAFLVNGDPPARARAALGIPPETTVIGTAGRLTAIKGQDVLIRAVAELVRRGEGVFLVLLGEGELRQELEQLTLRLGIAENVRFLGWRSDVARVMAACDIFCLPSRNEGMGKVLVEAMAMGIPIIASDIGGIRDIVQPGENGLLVPVGDVEAWTEAIAVLSGDPERLRRMGAIGRQRAAHYSSAEMIKFIDLLYGKLLNENRRMRLSKPPGQSGMSLCL